MLPAGGGARQGADDAVGVAEVVHRGVHRPDQHEPGLGVALLRRLQDLHRPPLDEPGPVVLVVAAALDDQPVDGADVEGTVLDLPEERLEAVLRVAGHEPGATGAADLGLPVQSAGGHGGHRVVRAGVATADDVGVAEEQRPGGPGREPWRQTEWRWESAGSTRGAGGAAGAALASVAASVERAVDVPAVPLGPAAQPTRSGESATAITSRALNAMDPTLGRGGELVTQCQAPRFFSAAASRWPR